VGMTNNLLRRVDEHKEGAMKGFTSQYRTRKLVYYEVFDRPIDAIAREKEVKGWLRAKKIALIESINPAWRDLAFE
jgi:putative endonuclease